ncbi:HlyD family type I secretion periplasmic adaptor subunit [Stutzerimonas degradans]
MADTRDSGNETLWRRYRRVWRHSWQNRRAMEPPKRLPHEVQFLPAALELQEKPVHPAPRIIIWTLIGFSALALIWACVGRIDVVATASGKIVPSGKTKVIQSSETAVVKTIYVRDGQSVLAGDVLLELDPTTAAADAERLEADLVAARIDRARAAAMLSSIETHSSPTLQNASLHGLDANQRLGAERWLVGQYQEYRSSLELAEAEIAQRNAEIQAAKSQVASLERTLPIATKLAGDYEDLLAQQYIARHAYLEKEQARLDLERQLSVQRSSVVQLNAALWEAQGRRENVVAQTRKAMLDLLHQSEQKEAALTSELAKATYQQSIKRLRAPVEGTVQQLATHTVGGVVTPALQLMVVVPTGQPVEVEALLENKDIGFVRPGQDVEVKVETFNFTKYGVLNGTVQSVSSDAIPDEKLGLVYSARILLKEDHIQINGQDVPLSPGMAIRAEVKTDKRRVIDYFLSPLQQYGNESLRER